MYAVMEAHVETGVRCDEGGHARVAACAAALWQSKLSRIHLPANSVAH